MLRHSNSQEYIIEGTAVSPGLAFAPVHVVARGSVDAPDVYKISKDDIESEQERFATALERTKEQLQKIQDRIETISGEEDGKIFEAHLMVLEDRTLLKRVSETITDRRQNAEFAFYAVIETYAEAMRRVNDPYLAERASDIDDVAQRVLSNFSDSDKVKDEEKPNHKHIIIAYDLSPSHTATIDRKQVMGFATEQGSMNSHTAILARSLGIPAIVGLEGAVLNVKSLSNSILDGYSGKIIINPTEETIAHYRALQKKKEDSERELEGLRERKTTTVDERKITLSANIEFSHEISQVQKAGAEGVGLFRTEFYLLSGGEIPDENLQHEVYAEVARGSLPHQAIIRTLDAGGDKLPAEPLPDPEPNPFLGWRGIRVSLARPSMFKEQIRAILRASAQGKLGVMFPLVSGIGELMAAKSVLYECMEELDKEGQEYDPGIEVGVMIEVPSAAIMADELAKEVDFFSIGTNDLIQYTVAVDRVNNHVSGLYKPTNPAVIRLIRRTVEAAAANGIWTGVCGEMAGDLNLTPLLIGLGVDELSVGSHQLPRIKKAVRSLSYAECSSMVDEALTCRFSSEILELSRTLAQQSYGSLLID